MENAVVLMETGAWRLKNANMLIGNAILLMGDAVLLIENAAEKDRNVILQMEKPSEKTGKGLYARNACRKKNLPGF